MKITRIRLNLASYISLSTEFATKSIEKYKINEMIFQTIENRGQYLVNVLWHKIQIKSIF